MNIDFKSSTRLLSSPAILVALIVAVQSRVSAAAPIIKLQPTNQATSLFADASFQVIALGDAPLAYQWQLHGTDLPGATNAILALPNIQPTQGGPYRAIIRNSCGSLTSQVASLTITPFDAVYCFGFSWTDTQGLFAKGGTTTPNGNTNYWQNRASNGPMWPELLSTNLGLTYLASHNYARGGASLEDVKNQVTSFPRPARPELSLYCLMMGNTIDISNEATWDKSILPDILSNSNLVSRLYGRGARTIMIESQFDQDPSEQIYFGTNNASRARYHQAYRRLNSGFEDAMNLFHETHPDARVIFVDIFSKLDEILTNPVQYGFTKTDIGALEDTTLEDHLLTGLGATYLFWDEFHPTAKFHHLLAGWHLQALADVRLEKLSALFSSSTPSIALEHLQVGRDYSLEETEDFNHWVEVNSFTAAAGTNHFPWPVEQRNGSYVRLKWTAPGKMIFIPGGTFTMGSPANEFDRLDDEGPQRSVTLTRGFFLGKYPVTQGEYLAVTGSNPSRFNGDHTSQGGGNFGVDLNRPVENMAWEDATNYCQLLTQRHLAAGIIPAGSLYRLPTEAEWEYACRAGTSTRFFYGDDPNYTDLTRYAWYEANANSGPQAVGQKLPNSWGLFDMLGNVLEYCQDWYAPYAGGSVTDPQGGSNGLPEAHFQHVFRGGGWFFLPGRCRCATRNRSYPDAIHGTIGFRVVLAQAL